MFLFLCNLVPSHITSILEVSVHYTPKFKLGYGILLSLQVSLNIEIRASSRQISYKIKSYIENLIPTNYENQEVFFQKKLLSKGVIKPYVSTANLYN